MAKEIHKKITLPLYMNKSAQDDDGSFKERFDCQTNEIVGA